MRLPRLRDALFCIPLTLTPILAAQTASAPGAASTPAAARILGTVTAMTDTSVTVRPEGAAASEMVVAITPQTRLLRIAPGEKNLKNATPLQLTDLATGDRVLIRPTGDSTPDHPSASVLIAMKQGDISQAQEQETADWQKRGVAGIVQSVDAGSGTVTLKPQGGAAPLVIHTSGATVIRHYAPDSTAFADTRKAALTDIRPGDQVRARGAKDEATSSITAEELVAGSFRNVAGTILSTDPAANTVSVTDLATKKPVTLHIESGTQLRKLPPEMAARLARREEAGGTSSAGGAGGGAARGTEGGEGTGRPHAGSHDMAGMLQRAPAITLADLKKGDAVMIVASGPGAPQATAITLISGVDALLQASPEASAGLFSASWNLGGGGADAAGGEGSPQR